MNTSETVTTPDKDIQTTKKTEKNQRLGAPLPEETRAYCLSLSLSKIDNLFS